MPIILLFFFCQRWIINWPEDKKRTFQEEEAERKEEMQRQRKYALELKEESLMSTSQASLKARLDLLIALSQEPPCRLPRYLGLHF